MFKTKIVELPEYVIHTTFNKEYYLVKLYLDLCYDLRLHCYEITKWDWNRKEAFIAYFDNHSRLVIVNSDERNISFKRGNNSIIIYDKLIYDLATSQITDGIFNLCRFTIQMHE